MEGSRSDQEPSKASPGETGCGCSPSITISITPTTGGQFELHIARTETIESLKKLISKKLKVPKERICLLHRDRQLRGGTLEENQLMHGSKLTLLPSVETGLLAQRPEQSVMQALESLNDSQVNDFLSGKAPLNLTMRLGDHMMLIQLQLSTVTPSAAAASSSSSSSSSSSQTTLNSSRRSTTTAAGSSTSSTTTSSATPICSTSSSGRQSLVSSLSSVFSGLDRNTRSPHSNSSTSTTPTTTTTTTNSTTLVSPAKVVNPSSTSSTSSSTSSTSTSTSQNTPIAQTNATTPTAATGSCPRCEPRPRTALDTRALAEASRNLTQTLKQLSSEVLTSRSDTEETTGGGTSSTSGGGGGGGATATTALNAASSSGATPRPGAIIESMHHHGKGVYSGTFSGTLNPALQDRFGRPKRDISTIIHILNDLLCATPHYRGPAPVHANATTNATTTSTSQSSANECQIPTAPSSSLPSGATALAAATALASSNAELVAEAPLEADEKMETCEPEAVLSRENQATRGKLEQLRLVMEERRARRRARREARGSPYPTPAHPMPLTPSSQWSADGAGAPSQPGQQPPTEPVLA